MYAGNFCSLRKPAITGDVPPLIGNQLYSQSRKKNNFIFTTTPTTKCILSKKHTFSLFTASVVFFSTKCLSSNDYPVRQGNKYSLCLIEIFNLIISKSLSETHNFSRENIFSVFVDGNVFEFQRGHGAETHVLNLIIKWTKHKINILYLCCKFLQTS